MEKRYNLVLTGLQAPSIDPQDLIDTLRTQLRFEAMTARLAVSRTPFTLVRGISLEEALQLQEILEPHGAVLDFQDADAPAPLSDPFGSPQAPAPLLGQWDSKWETAPPPTTYEISFTTDVGLAPQRSSPAQPDVPMAPMLSPSETEKGFFDALPSAFLMPLRGRGISWMLLIGLFTFVGLFAMIGIGIVLLLVPFLSLIVNLILFGVLLTLNARFFFATFSAAIQHEDQPEPFPELRDNQSELILGGLVLLGWFMTAFLPLYLWISRFGGNPRSGAFSLVFFLFLLFLPFFFWPISLVQMASGSISRMWYFHESVRAVLQSPLKYSIVVLFGFVAGVVPVLLSNLIQSAKLGFFVNLLALFVLCLPMTYSHGVMGAMMGHLANETPEILPEHASEAP